MFAEAPAIFGGESPEMMKAISSGNFGNGAAYPRVEQFLAVWTVRIAELTDAFAAIMHCCQWNLSPDWLTRHLSTDQESTTNRTPVITPTG